MIWQVISHNTDIGGKEHKFTLKNIKTENKRVRILKTCLKSKTPSQKNRRLQPLISILLPGITPLYIPQHLHQEIALCISSALFPRGLQI